MTEIVVKIGTWFLDAYESTLTDKEALSAYLPWTKQVQASCRYILNIINPILAQAKVGF